MLVGFGLSLATANAILTPLSLGLMIVGSIGTSAAVILNYHPVWSLFIAGIVPAHRFPFAYQSFNHFFLLLSAWLSAIWLYLVLGETGLPIARQGIFLVVFAAAWFVLGRMLSNLPGVVGWPVMGAGWLMWLIGLIDVFFSPNEAIITMIVGLAISGEALRRSRAIYWIPVFVLQVVFMVLQAAWMFALPSWFLLLVVGVALGIGGMVADRSQSWAARITAIMGAALVGGFWVVNHNMPSLLGLMLLAAVAALRYQRWYWLLAICLGVNVFMFEAGYMSDWRVLLVYGTGQILIGLELVRFLRPRGFRTLQQAFLLERDWATSFLWVGIVPTFLSIGRIRWGESMLDSALFFFAIAVITALYAAKRRMKNLVYWPLVLASIGLVMYVMWMGRHPLAELNKLFIDFNITLATFALITTGLCGFALQDSLRAARSLRWWIRPLLKASTFVGLISFVFLVILSGPYRFDPALVIVNGVLLMAWAWLTYARRRQSGALLGALLVSGYTWGIIALWLHINSVLIYSIPAGMTLLVLGRRITRPERTLLESAGVLVLLVGATGGINLGNPLSLSMLVLGAHVVSLLIYGYLAGRRIPFAIAAIVIGGGVIGAAAKINLWLIPLACGLVLLTATIVLEAQREMVAGWLQQWRSRWQQWT